MKDAVKCAERQIDGIPKAAKPACKEASKNPSACNDSFEADADDAKESVEEDAELGISLCANAAFVLQRLPEPPEPGRAHAAPRHGAPATPAATSSAIRSADRPDSASTLRVCSPVRHGPAQRDRIVRERHRRAEAPVAAELRVFDLRHEAVLAHEGLVEGEAREGSAIGAHAADAARAELRLPLGRRPLRETPESKRTSSAS